MTSCSKRKVDLRLWETAVVAILNEKEREICLIE